jgi:hypothetical protein
MEIQCNNCKSLLTDELLAAIIAGNVKGDFHSLIMHRCIAALIKFLIQNRHMVGVEWEHATSIGKSGVASNKPMHCVNENP